MDTAICITKFKRARGCLPAAHARALNTDDYFFVYDFLKSIGVFSHVISSDLMNLFCRCRYHRSHIIMRDFMFHSSTENFESEILNANVCIHPSTNCFLMRGIVFARGPISFLHQRSRHSVQLFILN